MSEIDKLVLSIKHVGDGARQAQIRFVECVSVDWENKTMNAKGTGDGVEYLDVALGFGYTDIKPAVGSLCLIGIVDGQEVVTFVRRRGVAESVCGAVGRPADHGNKTVRY
jgi:glycyl-tRNA synthetase alpha subunit